MSTYYYFKCNKCNRRGGFFSRQAWGWGNFDIIDSFKFIAFHTDVCGEENIRVISEENDDYEEDLNTEKLDFYMNDSYDHFPLSNDWKFMMDNGKEDFYTYNSLWVNEKTLGLEPDNCIKLRGVITDVEYKEKKKHYFYKAYFIDEDMNEYTFLYMDKKLPTKGSKYYILGELLSKKHIMIGNIGEIKGTLINILNMKLIDESK